MESIKYKFPGDPVSVCHVMTRAEFLKECPREPIQIWSSAGVTKIDVPADTVICDLCNADPKDKVFYCPEEGKAYCGECAEEWILKYRVKERRNG